MFSLCVYIFFLLFHLRPRTTKDRGSSSRPTRDDLYIVSHILALYNIIIRACTSAALAMPANLFINVREPAARGNGLPAPPSRGDQPPVDPLTENGTQHSNTSYKYMRLTYTAFVYPASGSLFAVVARKQ